MAFHTFRHPNFAGKYRGFRLVTDSNPEPPKPDWVPAEVFQSADELKWMFRIADEEWMYAQSRIAELGYFVYGTGVFSDLPD